MRNLWLGLGLGLTAGILATSTLVLGNRRVDEWETLTPAAAPEGDFVTLADGTRMRFIQRGNAGTPIVLIHGLMDSADFWHHNLDALAQHHRVWAIDLVGFGYSSRINEPVYSLQYFARAIREFMDVQGITRAHVIGHSLGGAVTLQLARDYPAHVNKLILIAPGTFLINSIGLLTVFARVPFVPRALMGFALTSEHARWRAYRNALGNPAHFNPYDAQLRIRPMRVCGTADALVAMATSRWTNNLENELSHISAPTLIVWGDRDRAVPVAHAEKHARALPNAKLVILEGAGHIPHIEFPAIVNPLFKDFLEGTPEKTILPRRA